MQTSAKIALAILSLPFTSFGLFYAWVELTTEPIRHYIDALASAAWQVERYCKEEKLTPCDFKLEKSSDPDSDYWEFSFYSKTHQKIRNVEVIPSSEGFMAGFRD